MTLLLVLFMGMLTFVHSFTHTPYTQHSSRAVCFDMYPNGGTKNAVETTGTIYVENNGYTNQETGIDLVVQGMNIEDCIRMTLPRADEYTYIWTTSSDALWIDQFELFADACGSHQKYGDDNTAGWCLSTEAEDAALVGVNTCFEMIRLGKPSLNDDRVWGYHYTRDDRRRQLEVNELVEAVKTCEKNKDQDCSDLATKVIEALLEDDHSWIQTSGKKKQMDDCHAFPELKDGRSVPVKETLPVKNGEFVTPVCEEVQGERLLESFQPGFLQCVEGAYRYYGPFEKCAKGEDCTYGLDFCSTKETIEQADIPNLDIVENLWKSIQQKEVAKSKRCPSTHSAENPNCFLITKEDLHYELGLHQEINDVFGLALDVPSKLTYDVFIGRWKRDIIFANGLLGNILEYDEQGRKAVSLYLRGATSAAHHMNIHVTFCYEFEDCEYVAYSVTDKALDEPKKEFIKKHIKQPEGEKFHSLAELREANPNEVEGPDFFINRLAEKNIPFDESSLYGLTGGDRRRLQNYEFVSLTIMYNKLGVDLEDWEIHSWVDHELRELNLALEDHGVQVRVWKRGIREMSSHSNDILRTTNGGDCREATIDMCKDAEDELVGLKADLYMCIIGDDQMDNSDYGCAYTTGRFSVVREGVYFDDNSIAHEICHNFGQSHHTFGGYLMSKGTSNFDMHANTATTISNFAAAKAGEQVETIDCHGN